MLSTCYSEYHLLSLLCVVHLLLLVPTSSRPLSGIVYLSLLLLLLSLSLSSLLSLPLSFSPLSSSLTHAREAKAKLCQEEEETRRRPRKAYAWTGIMATTHWPLHMRYTLISIPRLCTVEHGQSDAGYMEQEEKLLRILFKILPALS